MSYNKKPRNKNTSNESPIAKDENKLIKVMRKSNVVQLKKLGNNKADFMHSDSIKSGEHYGRTSLGADEFDEDYNDILNSLKKNRRNFK
mmetsp:Transcript_31179/g.27567  ORF Transcript_31179/g.27567 Transcript_31179/m.27567 type:complete len:89 (-) Transcript_31179:30-296(-)